MKKLLLSAAFLAIGTFAMAQQNNQMQKMQKRDPAQMEQKRAERMKMMQTELNLSNDQVAKIKDLQDRKMAERKANEPQMKADRKAKMEEMKTKRDQWNSEMKQILTPEQYQKWQSNNKGKMQDLKGKMDDRRMNTTPAKN